MSKILENLYIAIVGIVIVAVGVVGAGWLNSAISAVDSTDRFGTAIRTNAQVATGTPVSLVAITANFSSTSTVSFSGGERLVVKLFGKPGTATSTIDVKLQTSSDGTYWFAYATTTPVGGFGAPDDFLRFTPGTAGATSTITFPALDVFDRFVRASFRTSDLSTDPNDGASIYAELVKVEQY